MSVEIDPPEQLEFNRRRPAPADPWVHLLTPLSARAVYTASGPSLEGHESQRCAHRVQGQDNRPKKVRLPHTPCRPWLC